MGDCRRRQSGHVRCHMFSKRRDRGARSHAGRPRTRDDPCVAPGAPSAGAHSRVIRSMEGLARVEAAVALWHGSTVHKSGARRRQSRSVRIHAEIYTDTTLAAPTYLRRDRRMATSLRAPIVKVGLPVLWLRHARVGGGCVLPGVRHALHFLTPPLHPCAARPAHADGQHPVNGASIAENCCVFRPFRYTVMQRVGSR